MQLFPIAKIFSNRDSIRTARDAFLIPIVPEEGWFVQPKYNTSSKNHPTLCRFLLLYSLFTGSLFQFTSLTGFLLRYTCSLQAPFLHVTCRLPISICMLFAAATFFNFHIIYRLHLIYMLSIASFLGFTCYLQ